MGVFLLLCGRCVCQHGVGLDQTAWRGTCSICQPSFITQLPSDMSMSLTCMPQNGHGIDGLKKEGMYSLAVRGLLQQGDCLDSFHLAGGWHDAFCACMDVMCAL